MKTNEDVSVVERQMCSLEQGRVEGLTGRGGSGGGGDGGVHHGGVGRSHGASVIAAAAGAATDAVATSHSAARARGRIRRLRGHHLKSAQDKRHVYINNQHLFRSKNAFAQEIKCVFWIESTIPLRCMIGDNLQKQENRNYKLHAVFVLSIWVLYSLKMCYTKLLNADY